MSTELNRREFLGRSMAGGAVLAAGLNVAAQDATPVDPVIVGVVGMNRGKALALDFVKAPGCRIKYVCDLTAVPTFLPQRTIDSYFTAL